MPTLPVLVIYITLPEPSAVLNSNPLPTELLVDICHLTFDVAEKFIAAAAVVELSCLVSVNTGNVVADKFKRLTGLAVPIPTLSLVESTNSVFESTLIPLRYRMAIILSVYLTTKVQNRKGLADCQPS
jgi:hypothetical protein